MVRTLFGDDEVLGAEILIGSVAFRVIGILEPFGTDLHGMDRDNEIVVPISTMMRRVMNVDTIAAAKLLVGTPGAGDERREGASREILRERHGLAAGQPNDFTIISAVEVQRMVGTVQDVLLLYLPFVAGVALVAGGLVSSTLMLASVNERVAEIGVRRAVGARPADIRLQFLVETAVTTLAGGGLGIVVGYAAAVFAASRWQLGDVFPGRPRSWAPSCPRSPASSPACCPRVEPRALHPGGRVAMRFRRSLRMSMARAARASRAHGARIVERGRGRGRGRADERHRHGCAARGRPQHRDDGHEPAGRAAGDRRGGWWRAGPCAASSPRSCRTTVTRSPPCRWSLKPRPGVEGVARVKAASRSTLTKVQGTTAAFLASATVSRRRGPLSGSMTTTATARRVAVLGARVAEALFPGDEAVGREIRVRGVPFDVIGVLEPKGTVADGADEDSQIVVPLRTALRRVLNTTWLNTVFVSVRDPARMTDAESAIVGLLRARHRSPREDAPDDFAVQNVARFLAIQRDAAGSLGLATTALGAIALLVGGAGILALMTLSVRERTVFELAITETNIKNVTRFDREEVAPIHSVFSRTISSYDPLFWGNQDFLRPEDNLLQALKNMNVKLQEFSK